MVKNAKTGLGRALVKHHNQMVQQSKEKGYFYYNQGKKVLESVTEVNDIEAVIEQAEEAERLYSADHPVPNLLINLDGATDTTHEEWRELQMKEEALHASSLRVPRRPPWTAEMSVEELDDSEKQAFLVWRRSLARLEENEKLVLTPFEKNLDIWRQLWRVLERSDLLVMVVDARDPLFYRCPDLEAYAQEIDKNKKTLLLVNKADLLPLSVREKWAKYFHDHGILFLFWSAKAASTSLDGKKLSVLGDEQNTSCSEDIDTRIYSRDELLDRLQAEAEAIAAIRRGTSYNDASPPHDGLTADNATPKHVVVGFVGYPNVGKSSTINALVGEKRTGVTSTPGKTKHFQTLIISDKLMLCDCPGLVFPSFTSSRYDMIASGVLPIDRMTEHREAVQVVANRVPRHIIEKVYNIRLPMPKPYESQSRPPLASELLMAFCYSRGHFASSGLPDETRAARQILKDYIDGKLTHFEMPPVMTAGTDKEVTLTNSDLDPSDTQDDQTAENTNSAGVDRLLQDLDSFDITDGSGITNAAPTVKKPKAASHKQHKKPQRKKDRSWRVGRDADEVMQHVRTFQKPVNVGPVKSE